MILPWPLPSLKRSAMSVVSFEGVVADALLVQRLGDPAFSLVARRRSSAVLLVYSTFRLHEPGSPACLLCVRDSELGNSAHLLGAWVSTARQARAFCSVFRPQYSAADSFSSKAGFQSLGVPVFLLGASDSTLGVRVFLVGIWIHGSRPPALLARCSDLRSSAAHTFLSMQFR